MELEDLVGETVDFHGVDCNTFCVTTDDGERIAFEAVEDESDGYRSMLEEVKQTSLDGNIFFDQSVARVTVTEAEERGFNGYELTDEDGHVWLRVGTDNCDDYYPVFTFTFRYDPARGE